jgi:phthiocerol/phenolphthiocerol synthesis type-I polyketide synthase D
MGHGSERPEPQGGSGQPAVPGEDELRRLITLQLADMLGLPQSEIDPDRPLEEHGLSSRDTVALAGYLEGLLDRPLPPTLVWEHPTISGLASALSGTETGGGVNPAAPPGPAAAGSPEDDLIAVVGMGCRFPGGAAGTLAGPESFWNFLLARGEGIGEIPPERWAAFDDGSPAAGDALARVTRSAGVLDDITGFDAAFFGISPGEALAMDPQQRLLLEVCWEALEQAGLPPASLRGSRTGVFTGISAAEYAFLTTSDLSKIDAWTATGAAASIAAGRISYLLDLRGPSMAVDTACSSSLLSTHLAAASLRRRESDLALAGGVNLLLSPVITMTFDAGGGTSADGHCRPFDARANGMVRGEGCGIVVLKRLADARRDGDRVLAVITATAVNSDGRSNGLVAPSTAAQRDVLRAAHTAAGQHPGQVDYVEAHGTGTPLGDPIEAQALGQVLGVGRPEGRPLLIGSVKGNIGHLEAAAGVAGLIKTVLALAHRQIPPTLNFTAPSPHVPLADLGLAVAARTTDWPANPWPPTAGVSAFGFSGTNVHVVLAAAPAEGDPARTPSQDREPVACLLSDKSAERVRDRARQLGAWLDGMPSGEPALRSLARTLDRQRGRGPHRAVVIARDRAELAAGLGALGAGEPNPGVVTGTAGQAGPGVAFVFSGYGSQWAGMGRALAAAEPVFAEALAEVQARLSEAAGLSFAETAGNAEALRQVQHAQPAVFAIQVALARLWEARGVQPAAVIGHSMGEVAAAVVSGALSVADGARVITCRSRLLYRLAGAGAMGHVGLAPDEVSKLAADLPDVHLAVLSSPAATVVTGDAVQVAGLVDRARAAGASARVLAAEGAGHSPQVDPLLGELTAQLTGITAGPARPRFYSTVHDDPRTPSQCDADYWAANLRRPVRLGPAVAAAARDGLRTFVEVSPHPLLARPLAETVRHETGEAGVITGTLRRNTDEVLAFHAALATLLTHGVSLPRPGPGPVIDLPPAPWRHETYWPDPPLPPAPPGHPLLGAHVELPTGGHAWQLRADRTTWGWLPEAAPFPLSAAAEMTMAAACEAWQEASTAVQVSDLRLARPRPVGADSVLTTTLDALQPDADGGRRAAVRIHAQDAAGAWQLLATATASSITAPATGPESGPDPEVTGIRGVQRARGQHIPAEILDRCLAAACADGDEMATAIGSLRVRGSAAGGGQCRLGNVRRGHGQVTADLRLTVDPPGDEPILIEALDVHVSRVPRTAIPVPYRDKLVELSWQRQDLTAGQAVDEPRWVLAGEEGGLARELAARLRSAGHKVETGAEGHDGATPTGAVLVAPRPPLDHEASGRFVLTAIEFAASLAAQPGPPARLWIVTAGSTAVRPGEAGHPGLAAVRGLVRVLALERPGLRATLVDLDPAESHEAAAACLASELIADEPDDEVSWRDGSRLVARLVRGEAGRRAPCPAVRAGGGYIVTGGCGGLGLVVARWLAERGAGRIVLNGRSGAAAQIRPALEQLRATGATVRVVRGDIAKPGVAEKLVAAAGGNGTPLRGIVHAAGVSADALLGNVTADDVSRVWSPKVTGAWRLHEAIEHARAAQSNPDWAGPEWAGPDWFLMFSSAAALVGSPGQAAYATANAWLDAFAAWRQARGLPATAINWGVWAAAGQASDVAIGGIEPIVPDEGVEALEALLTEGRAAAGVIRMDPAAAAKAFPEIVARPFFGSLLASGPGHGGGGRARDWPGAETVRADPERHRALIEERALTQVAAVLGLAPDQLPPDLALTDAGLDSLAAQRIGYLLEHDLAVTIDPALLLGGGTVAQLRHALAAELGLEPAATPSPNGAGGRPLASRNGSSHAVEPRDAAERQVARVVADVLGIAVVGVTDDLRAAGLTAAARAEIAGRLEREAGRDVDASALFAVSTVEAAADLVRQAEDGEVSGLIRTIQAGAGALPVLLAHPAGGTTGVYRALAGLLGRDRPVFGLERLSGEVSDRSRRYADAVRERFPGGCVLGGWSYGGVLGYETARQLAADGYRVPLVVLLDAALPRPVPHGDEDRHVARRFVAFADYLTRTYGREVRLSEGDLLGRPEDEQLGVVVRRMSEAGLDGKLSPAILRHQRTSYEDTRSLERYRAGGYEGPAVLYRAERETPWTVRDPRYDISGEARGWDRLCPHLEVAGIDAHHLNLLDPPAVTVVGAHLRELLSRIGDES